MSSSQIRSVIALSKVNSKFTEGESGLHDIKFRGMAKGKLARSRDNNGHSLLRIRVVISLLLFMYCVFVWREQQHLSGQRKLAEETLRRLYQMQSYAQRVCGKKGKQLGSVGMEKDMEIVRLSKRQDVTSKTVNNEVTFILMGPTIRCLRTKMSWITNLYKDAKIVVALDVSALFQEVILNVKNLSYASENKPFFLGATGNRAESLNRAIKHVSTKYFLIIDHSIDLSNMRSDYVEVLLKNMPGFDVLGGAMVDTSGEFVVPCKRVALRNWSFQETYEYNISGNVLRCETTSLYFMGRAEAFRHPILVQHLFDSSLPSNWLEDFFIRLRGILEVGVLPELLVHKSIPHNCFNVPPNKMSLSEITDRLLPFAYKYQVFFIDDGSDHLNICQHSTKLICSEEKITKQWDLGHPSVTGLTAYPFVIESLEEALHFGVRRLEESHLLYIIEGGTLLGLVKVRDVLPWDHGDVDTFVYSTRRSVIRMVLKTYREYGYTYWLRHTGFHTYVSKNPSSLNGCIVYLTRRTKPNGIIYIRHHGKLFAVRRDLFKFLRIFYGSQYFESHMKSTNERAYCWIGGHHACMPDCRWDGCGGGHGAFPGIL